MRSHWAALGPVLVVAVQAVAASYVPNPPNSATPTLAAAASNYLLGISPRITDSPIPDPPGLVGRDDAAYSNSANCGFYADGYPVRCYADTATCAYGPKFAACCVSSPCGTIFTGCYPYSDNMKGSCVPEKLKTESQMACCWDSTAPNCVLHTLLVSSTSLGVWGCGSTTTGHTIFATNPMLPSQTSGSPTSTSSSTTSPTSESSAGGSNTGEKKSNTGAIVGGVVGGVGALAIIAAVIFFSKRSRKSPSAVQPMLEQQQRSPPPGQDSPFGYHSLGSPVYDPNMAYQYYQGSPQPNTQSSPSPYDPHRSSYASWGQPSPGLTSSPDPRGSFVTGPNTPATQGHTNAGEHHVQPVELSSSSAVGTAENRAELG